MSLVDQMSLIVQRKANSQGPGHVRAFDDVAPCARPLVRFFCMSFNLEIK